MGRGLLSLDGWHCGRARKGSVEYSVLLAIVCLLVVAAAGTTARASVREAASVVLSDTRQTSSGKDDAVLNRTSNGSPRQYDGIAICIIEFVGILAVVCFLGWHSWLRYCWHKERVPLDVPDSQILETKDKLFAKRHELVKMLHLNVGLLSTNKIEVRHLMTPNPATVSSETRVEVVKSLMEEKRWHHILVCGTGLELLGVISDRDLHCRFGHTARQIMTPQPNFVTPDTPLGIAITQLVARQVSCLPVVDAGRVCGILTTTDLVLVAHAFLQMWLRLRQDGKSTDLMDHDHEVLNSALPDDDFEEAVSIAQTECA